MSSQPWQTPELIQHAHRLWRSFEYWTSDRLLAHPSPEALFHASFVLVSHGTEADPILNYGNQQALALWEMTWEQLTRTPSRYTAEPMNWQDRDRLLAATKQWGYVSNYEGIRISRTGRRFWIRAGITWDVLDEQNQRCGQAAKFDRWDWLPDTPTGDGAANE